MITMEIETLKRELNQLLGNGADFEQIYNVSTRLDQLIVRYYYEKNQTRKYQGERVL